MIEYRPEEILPGERSRRMKKAIVILLAFLFLCGSSLAEEAASGTVSFGDVSFDRGTEYIDLGDQSVGNLSSFISFLQEFPNLKKVDMFATQIDRNGVQKLEEALPDVTFGWTLQLMKYKNKHIVRTDAEAFSTLHGVCPNHNDNDFLLLKYCTSLLALDLGHNYVSDLSFLRNMPHLRVLILGENTTLKNIEVIGELKELEYLELFTCGFTDISPLVNLPNLMDLNLSNNKVKDWRPLKEMKQLKRLWISGMCSKKMTEAEKKELQEALPDTEIVFNGRDPMDKGWRTDPKTKANHPHYDVIYEIFHTGKYIPFEESAPLPGEESPSWAVEDVEEDLLNGE